MNSKGEFNVPVGNYRNPSICDEENLRACHRTLQGVDVRLRDFRDLDAGAGDFVYFDPPYAPLDSTSFTSYAKNGFGGDDQKKLRDLCVVLRGQGVKVLVSNSDTEFIRDLYSSAVFEFHEVRAPRMVNSRSDQRGAVNELLITNF